MGFAGTARNRRHRPARRCAAVPIALVALLTTAGAVSAAAPGGSASALIAVSGTACAPGWQAPTSGRTVFTVENVSESTIYAVDIVGADRVSVYGYIKTLAPGTEDTMDAVLPPGQYSFSCYAFSGPSLQSQAERVSGPPVTGAHPFVPVDARQIQQATLVYRATLTLWMHRLANATDALEAAVKSGQLAKARRLWLPAHLDYQRLGATSGTFGTLDAGIDGPPFSLQGGVDSPYFTGFLRLEYGLWSGQATSELTPVATALDQAAHGLLAQFPQMLLPVDALARAAQQVLESTLQLTMTGETDEGSHTDLATAWASVVAAQLALGAVTPLVRPSNPNLVRVLQRGLSSMAASFESYQTSNGTWAPLPSLSTAERERLDGQLGGLLEQFSVLPQLLEPIQPGITSS